MSKNLSKKKNKVRAGEIDNLDSDQKEIWNRIQIDLKRLDFFDDFMREAVVELGFGLRELIEEIVEEHPYFSVGETSVDRQIEKAKEEYQRILNAMGNDPKYASPITIPSLFSENKPNRGKSDKDQEYWEDDSGYFVSSEDEDPDELDLGELVTAADTAIANFNVMKGEEYPKKVLEHLKRFCRDMLVDKISFGDLEEELKIDDFCSFIYLHLEVYPASSQDIQEYIRILNLLKTGLLPEEKELIEVLQKMINPPSKSKKKGKKN